MALPVDKLIVCPVIVGRTRYVTALSPIVDGVLSGSGRVVAISGEAGLGKSRLVTETKRQVAAAGAAGTSMLVMQGNCFEPDRTLPYAPFLDLIRNCIATRDPAELTACLGPHGPELAKLVPELAFVVPGLEASPAADPEQEKRRLFHAMAEFFTRVAAREPLLIVIEDMHWSDDTSLELLSQMARRLHSSRILIVVTFRSDEVQPALRQALASLDREHVLLEWPLERLTNADAERMIQAIFELDTPVRADFLDAIYSLTEGNPFFIEEVLKSLVAAGDIFYADGAWDRKPLDQLQIPRSIHAAVSARTSHLSEAAQRTLTIAAVAGRRFDFDVLQRMTSIGESELVTIIKELVSAQLVVEGSADHYGFRHALTQQAIYSDMLVRERRALHREIAATVRQLATPSPDARLPELAHHFYAAESWDEAYYYCRKLAESAQTMQAPAAAIEQYDRAIESAGHLGVTVPAGIYRGRGQAHEAHGDFEAALADYQRTLDLTTASGEGTAQWQALIDLGFLWSGRDYARSGDLFRQASALAKRLGDPIAEARSLNRLGNWLVNTGDTGEGVILHERALSIFRDRGDEDGVVETQDLLGMAYGLNNDIGRGIASLSAAIDALRPGGLSPVLCSALTTRATWSAPNHWELSAPAVRTLHDCIQDTDDARAMAQQLDSPAALSYVEWVTAGALDAYGHPHQAVGHAKLGLRLAQEIGHDQWIAGARFTLGRIWLSMLAFDDGITELEACTSVARDVGSAWWLGSSAAYLAFAHIERGDLARADAVLGATWPSSQEPRSLSERRVLWAWGRLALGRNQHAAGLAIAERLLGSVAVAHPGHAIPSLLQLKGDALLALRRTDEAISALEAGRDGAMLRGAPSYLWPVRRSLGRAYQAARRPDDAEREFAAARHVIAVVADGIADDASRERFERLAVGSLPNPRLPTANRAAKEAYGGLTGREREVAVLVARGRTNREIAEELVLGERTIETHVGNVLSKLGFSSRAQIAAWAVESGLTKAS